MASELGAVHGDPGEALPGAGPVADPTERPSGTLDPGLFLREAVEAGGVGTWAWLPDRAAILADATARRLWGFEPHQEIAPADLLGAIVPADRDRAAAALAAAVPGGSGEDFVRVGGGEAAAVWLQVRGREAFVSGRRCFVGICLDVTERMRAEEELRRARREARARFREIKALYNGAPVGLALLDRDLRQVRVNRRLAELLGRASSEPAEGSILEALPDLRPQLEPVLHGVLDSGEARNNYEIERLSRDGQRTFVYNCHFYPVRGEDGSVAGLGVVVEDATAHKAAAQARDLLSRELSHRIKNLFAVVSSLVTISARGDPSLQTFGRALRGRIEALGRAHDYVRPSEWDKDASRERTLGNLLTTVLAPYRGESILDGKPRIAITGCDVPIGSFAATALALTLYELATNAVKYGALSRPEGKVSVSCRVDGGAVELTWAERGGPPVEGPPTKEGFGSMLARRTFAADLGGAMNADWRPDGLVLTLTAPLSRLTR